MEENWDSSAFSAGTLDCLLCKESLEYVNGDRSDLLDHLNNVHQTKIHQNLVLAITFLDNKTLNNIIDQFEKHAESDSNIKDLIEEIDSALDNEEMIEENEHEKENEFEGSYNNEDLLQEIESDQDTVEIEEDGYEKENELEYEDIMKSSEYFRKNPKQMTTTCNPDLHFGNLFPLVDPNLPTGWKVRDHQTPSGNVEKHFLAPDGRVIKTKKAVIEYMKIMEEYSVENIISLPKQEEPPQPFFGDLWNHLTSNEATPTDEAKPKGKKRQRPDNSGMEISSRRVVSKEIIDVESEPEEIVEVKRVSKVKRDSKEIAKVNKASTYNNLNRSLSGVTFNCEHCGFNTTKKSDLQNHLKSIHEVTLLNCAHCDYMTTRRGNFKLHNNSVHGGLNIKCEFCEYKATKQGSLQQHVSTVHPEEPSFAISKKTSPNIKIKPEGQRLGKVISKELSFQRESKEIVAVKREDIKSGGKYDCEQCDYKATRPGNLQQHIKSVHMGVKYNCELCDFKASAPSALKMHFKSVHSGVKFNCEDCDYKATRKSNLQQHVKSVHLGVKYNCESWSCDYKASSPSSLLVHIKSVHAEDV